MKLLLGAWVWGSLPLSAAVRDEGSQTLFHPSCTQGILWKHNLCLPGFSYSAVPPLIPQLIVLKSRSLLGPHAMDLPSPGKPQYCEVIWDVTAMGRHGYFVQGTSNCDSAISHCYYQLPILWSMLFFWWGSPWR